MRQGLEKKIGDAMTLVRLLCADQARIGAADLFLWHCLERHPRWVENWPHDLLAGAALTHSADHKEETSCF